jgi:hypothetical protein
VSRIAIERFSPYFNRPDLGFENLRPAAHYAVIYDLPESELQDMAYVFDAAHRGISAEHGKRLEKAVDTWQHGFAHGRLTHCDLGSHIVLSNSRPGFDWRALRIEEPWEVAAFRLLDQPHSRKALTSKLLAGGHRITPDEVSALLRGWRLLGLLFEDADQAVHVVPHGANQDLMRCVAGENAPALVPALLDRTRAVPGTGAQAALRSWRGRDGEPLEEDDMYLGEVRSADDPAQTASDLAARGALHVALPGPVTIGHDDHTRDSVRMLTQVRELTGRGISVDWDLDLGPEAGRWQLFSHLYPPRSLAGADGETILDRWRRSWHMNKCGYRRGDGFIEILDLRHGTQRRIVMRKAHEGKLASLLRGASVADFRAAEIEAFVASALVHRVGDLLWWMPAHITRWPVVR